MELLNINEVKKVYKLKNKEKLYAVDGVSLNVKKGKCVGLVGESGCGKSTLGKMILGIEDITDGSIVFKGKKVGDIKRKDLLRKELQMVFQDSLSAVNRRSTVLEIIGEPLSNFYKLSKEDTIKRVEELLEKVGMNRSDKNKFPHQFSGGQLQRICIARALALSPSLLVLDEPLSSLDISIQAQILNLLSDLKKDLDLTYILISHDLEAVYYLSDSIVVMYKGKIMEHIEDIKDFYEMRHPYTKRLLASSYQYRSKVDDFIEEVNNSESIDGCPYFNRCINGRDICKENSPKLVEVSEGHKVACHYA